MPGLTLCRKNYFSRGPNTNKFGLRIAFLPRKSGTSLIGTLDVPEKEARYTTMNIDLTPRERLMILALQNSPEPMTLLQLMQRTGFKSTQPFRVSLRYLVGTGDLKESVNGDGEAVYSCSPEQPAVLPSTRKVVQKAVITPVMKVKPQRREATAAC